MNVDCVLMGPRASKRHVTSEAATQPVRSDPQVCFHSEVSGDDKGVVVRRCTNPVAKGKANGFLCWQHQRSLLETPVSKVIDNTRNAWEIAYEDGALIEGAMLLKDPNVLRLSDFRYCRRIWNRRGKELPSSIKMEDIAELPTFYGEDEFVPSVIEVG